MYGVIISMDLTLQQYQKDNNEPLNLFVHLLLKFG